MEYVDARQPEPPKDEGVRITGIEIPFRDVVQLILQIFFASLVAGIVIFPIAFIVGAIFGGL